MVEVTDKGQRRLRWGGAIWIALFLFWLPFEDFGVTSSVVVALAGLTWFYMRWWILDSEISLWGWVLRGIGLGVALIPAVIALVAVKAGLHAHGFADVSLLELQSFLNLWPWWVMGGLLAGLLGFWIREKRSQGG